MGKTYRATPPDDYDDHHDEFDENEFDEEGFYDLSDELFEDEDLENFTLDDADFRAAQHDEIPAHPHRKNAGHSRPLQPTRDSKDRILPHDWEDFDYGSDASNDEDRYDSRWA